MDAVFELLEIKPPSLHIVLTGRYANPVIIDRADLVTEMKEIKHPFNKRHKGAKRYRILRILHKIIREIHILTPAVNDFTIMLVY